MRNARYDQRRDMANTVIPLTVSLAEHRSLEARYDQLHDHYTEMHQALTRLVDALFSLPGPSLWTTEQQAHVRLALRDALRVLDAADDPAPGGLAL
jgi:hypothetical protein